MLKCPMPNRQWPFAKASFIELRVKATPEGMLLRRFSLKSGINFAHFSLESGMVLEGATGVYESIFPFNWK